jgi:alpha-maltose-1-phosphate synthase
MRIASSPTSTPRTSTAARGVHVEYLSRELARARRRRAPVDVLCFGDQREDAGNLRVRGITPPRAAGARPASRAAARRAACATSPWWGGRAPDIVHCHTWYSHLAGCLARPLTGARLVLTTHSLEPHRPWKEEQLGTPTRHHLDRAHGVPERRRRDRRLGGDEGDVQALYGVPPDRVRVIHNGIDPDEYRPARTRRRSVASGRPGCRSCCSWGGSRGRRGSCTWSAPSGTSSRACRSCSARARRTPRRSARRWALVAEARRESPVPHRLDPRDAAAEDVIALYSHADVFVCPSVYEPFGIINLEAMACETPVVAFVRGGRHPGDRGARRDGPAGAVRGGGDDGLLSRPRRGTTPPPIGGRVTSTCIAPRGTLASSAARRCRFFYDHFRDTRRPVSPPHSQNVSAQPDRRDRVGQFRCRLVPARPGSS